MKTQEKEQTVLHTRTHAGQTRRRLLCIMLSMAMLISTANTELETKQRKTAKAASYKATQKEINHFFGQSAIIGNSVGVGLKNFFDTKKKGYLGNPTMLVQGSYSFLADFNRNKQFMIHYRGRAIKARDAVKASKAKHVFINMGVNDFNTSKNQIFTNYKKFIEEIKTTNPNVDFYILATTPTWKAKGRINNKEINKLNKNMKTYARKTKDIYYIDINTPLKGTDGRLKQSYVSDGFLHLRMNAYEIWTKHMVNFVKKQLKIEKKANALIKTARKKLNEKTYKKAVSAVSALDKSTLKSKLQKKLQTIKKLIQKKNVKVSAAHKPTKTPSPTETPMETASPMETSSPMETASPMETSSPMETTEPVETSSPMETTEPAQTSEQTQMESLKKVQKKGLEDAVQTSPAPTETAETVQNVKPGRMRGLESNQTSPVPDGTTEPAQTPEPTQTPEPAQTLEPTQTPEPAKTPKPTQTPKPVKTPTPAERRQESINKGKWKLKKKHVYYYDSKKKKVKGFVTIKSKKYYFDKKGVQLTGWQKIKGSYYFFRLKNKADGYMVKNKTINKIKLSKTGEAKAKAKWKKQKLALMVECQKILTKITNATMTTNQKLRAAYDYERKHYYIKGSHTFHYSKHWDLVYARRMFRDGHGACFEWGAFYAYLANAAGGKVCAAVSSFGHGWAEVDGLCSDPDWEFADKRHSYFQFSYDLSGVGGRPNYKNNRSTVKRV